MMSTVPSLDHLRRAYAVTSQATQVTPLLESRALAPLWHRMGGFLYRHGESFYNFEGLRHYKEKFLPAWEPRYLASPGGLQLARALYDVSTLISGGLKELVSK